jgi:hypothetical protein
MIVLSPKAEFPPKGGTVVIAFYRPWVEAAFLLILWLA